MKKYKGTKCTKCNLHESTGAVFTYRKYVCDKCSFAAKGLKTCKVCHEKRPQENFRGKVHCGCKPDKIYVRKCIHCKQQKPLELFQNSQRCGDCIKTRLCKFCGLQKPSANFKSNLRCGDCTSIKELDTATSRHCIICNNDKPLKDFPLFKNKQRQTYRRFCRECKRVKDRQYAKEKAHIRSAYAKNNPEVIKAAINRRRHKATAKLTKEDIELSVAYRVAIKNDVCFFCGVSPGTEDEHWIAISNGGTDHWYNLSRSCKDCNRGPDGKWTKSPKDFYVEKLKAGLPINPKFAARVLEE